VREPDRTGVGRAWLIDPLPRTPDQAATVRAWLLRGPWHPAWSAWHVAVVHLRPVEGALRKPYLQFPDASHEFLILSLVSPPGSDLEPDPDDVDGWIMLSPADAVVQVAGITDEQAAAICDLMVQAILDGRASPDSDYRSFWEGAIAATAAHYRYGEHGAVGS
jgi:hypothetical protein